MQSQHADSAMRRRIFVIAPRA